MGRVTSPLIFYMAKQTWEDNILLNIKREFSQTEKYNILMKKYQEMEEQLHLYKTKVTAMQDKCVVYKKQYAQLQDKYVRVCKHFKINEYDPHVETL
jgi:hypothetical protein